MKLPAQVRSNTFVLFWLGVLTGAMIVVLLLLVREAQYLRNSTLTNFYGTTSTTSATLSPTNATTLNPETLKTYTEPLSTTSTRFSPIPQPYRQY